MLVRGDAHRDGVQGNQAREQPEIEGADEKGRTAALARCREGTGRASGRDQAASRHEWHPSQPGDARDRERAARARPEQVGEVEPVHVRGIGREGAGDAKPEEDEGQGEECVREQQDRQAAERAEELLRRQVDGVHHEEDRDHRDREGGQPAREPARGMPAVPPMPHREQRACRPVPEQRHSDDGVDEDRVEHHRRELHQRHLEVDAGEGSGTHGSERGRGRGQRPSRPGRSQEGCSGLGTPHVEGRCSGMLTLADGRAPVGWRRSNMKPPLSCPLWPLQSQHAAHQGARS